ncbi:DsbA family oxidoreductase [Mycolicibacillus trivialis]|uniref:DSBA-like thioredoxin domain-containing protein n=1 Tax=Mycolicibacillus trivialis TaxID=1798 RepID=A0A1X2EHL8_9MYCO|nr:DsbA family oxidoreductase [Mycolicibacillus trivialis]ORX01088.1 hypothetical protein AWC30_14530 [Mycolicibacillus trivialis]
MSRAVTVEVFSDVICPWCYIGVHRLGCAVDAVAENTGVRPHLAYRAYELNPDMPAAGISRREYRTAKFGSWERSRKLDAQTVAAAAGDGLSFDYDAITRTPNTRAAHRLIAAAEQAAGRGAALAAAVMAAYFRHGRDIGDPNVLTELAATIGLGAEVAGSLDDPALDRRVASDQARAATLGIVSVPVVLAGERVEVGAASVADYTALLSDTVAAGPQPR